MAVTLETGAIKRFRGLSTDEKPGRVALAVGDPVGEIPVGSVFTEIDTGARFVWGGSWPWVRQEQTIEALLNDLAEIGRETLAYIKAIHKGHEDHSWEEEVEVDYP